MKIDIRQRITELRHAQGLAGYGYAMTEFMLANPDIMERFCEFVRTPTETREPEDLESVTVENLTSDLQQSLEEFNAMGAIAKSEIDILTAILS